LLERLEALGADVEWRPAIAFDAPDDSDAVGRAVRKLSRYDWLLFTSANGVRFFQRALARFGAEWDASKGSIAAIGPATAEALVAAGHPPDLVARSNRAEGLVDGLARVIRSGQRALLVRPEEARAVIPDALGGMGVRVDTVAFYRTVPAPGIASTIADLEAGHFAIAVFTSPSAFRFLLECAGGPGGRPSDALRRAALVAIGEVTAEEIRRSGYAPAAVAAAPTNVELERAILSTLEGAPQGPRRSS